ncbi:MAG: DUF433 domain-containing protein [Chloroflexota bacterium]|nr:DUF433 domain-containing protein [Chloroflexota bacterium]
MRRILDTAYVVTNPKVCHGKITFRGTRVFVAHVLDDVAEGKDWHLLSKSWHGLALEAISEAVLLACQTFEEYADDYVVEYAREQVPA